jgi:ERCC4-type nuclease
MPFHNIFEKKESKSKNQIQKLPNIEVDYREKNSLVESELIYLGLQIEFKELKVADYIVNGIAIERKTVSDFISSMINKRLVRQLEELQQYENRLLIIEGLDEQELYTNNETGTESENRGIHPNAIRGFLLSILLQSKVPIIFSKNYEDTAKFIYLIAKKQDIETGINAKKKARSPQEQVQYIVEGFPGIGPKSAKKLLKKFGSIRNIINASEEELKTVLGTKSKNIKEIIDKHWQAHQPNENDKREDLQDSDM